MCVNINWWQWDHNNYDSLPYCPQISGDEVLKWMTISTNISTFIVTTTMTMLARAPQVRNESKIIRYTNYQVAANCKIITTYTHYKRVVSTNILSYWHTSRWSAPNANYLLAMDKHIFVHFASIPQFARMRVVCTYS